MPQVPVSPALHTLFDTVAMHLHAQVSAEQAQRNARVAALHLDAEQERARARVLTTSNDQLRRRALDLQRMTVEDPLTGLANRRHIDALLSGPQDGHWLAIVDVDHSKRINDDHSHGVGDAVLRRLGAILRDNCRPSACASAWPRTTGAPWRRACR